MHLKRFEAGDLPEALARIRSELGPEAVILETAPLRYPRRGVSVLAALPRDEQEASRASAGRPRASAAASSSSARTARAPVPAAAAAAAARPLLRPALPARLETAAEGATWARGLLGSAPAREERRLPHGAGLLSPPAPDAPAGATGAAGGIGASAATGPAAGPPDERAALRSRVAHLSRLVRSDHFSAVPLPLRQLYLDLTDAEVDADLAFQILSRLGSAPIPGQFTPAPPDEVLAFLRGLVECDGSLSAGEGRRVIALVGPTGVGKTTTVAKLAGHASFRLGLSVALVSTDGYRIFGAQHLAAYAALMGLPFYAAGSSLELRALLESRLRRTDLVLIDTSGRSPRDPRGIEEVHRILAADPGCEVHLALAANARSRDLALALDAFSVLPVRRLIFTKLDEATSTGGAFSAALKARRPVAWLGTGQEVPDDLEPATPQALTARLLEERPDGGSGR